MRLRSNLLNFFRFRINFQSEKLQNVKRDLALLADYFLHASRKKRIIAWLLVISIILCAVASVGLMAVLAWWNAGFFAALIAKDIVMLKTSCIIFTGIMLGFVAISSLERYLTQVLAIRWRKWLSKKFIRKFTDKNSQAYLKLHRTKTIDNPAQRMQQDLDVVINNAISLVRNFISSFISLITFTSTLWTLGGSLTFIAFGFNILIPGYLFWIAATCAVLSSVITLLIGSPLTALNKDQVKSEADYRREAEALSAKAESIALADASERYHKRSLKAKLKKMVANSYKLLNVSTKLAGFKSFCTQMPYILPYIVSAPIYFAGKIDMGQLMQLGVAFSMVIDSLSWFVNCFESIAALNASLARVVQLDQELSAAAKSDTFVGEAPSIMVTRGQDTKDPRDSIRLTDLSICVTGDKDVAQPILKRLNLVFKQGEHCVIQSEPGVGKSTLIKAIAGTWSQGQGAISAPARDQIYVVPQESYIPDDTLQAVLAYPDPADTYTIEQYRDALKAIGCGVDDQTQFIDQLNPATATFTPKTDWQTLSGGQKQLIAFARVLLQKPKPKWVLFDESTSALSVTCEKHVYEQVKKLEGVTMISIAHRPTVEAFHHKVVRFSKAEEDAVTKVDENPTSSSVAAASAPVP